MKVRPENKHQDYEYNENTETKYQVVNSDVNKLQKTQSITQQNEEFL